MHFHATQMLSVLQLIEWFEKLLKVFKLDPDAAKAHTYILEEESDSDGQPSLQVSHKLKTGGHTITYDAGFPIELMNWGEVVPEFTVTFKFACNEDEATEISLIYSAGSNKWQIEYDIQYNDHSQPPPTHIATLISHLNQLRGFDQISSQPVEDLYVTEDVRRDTDNAKNIIRNLVHLAALEHTI